MKAIAQAAPDPDKRSAAERKRARKAAKRLEAERIRRLDAAARQIRTNEHESQVVDYANPANNMYGCAPCPRCGEIKRAAYRRPYGPQSSGGMRIECDDCGHLEWAAPPANGSEAMR